MGEVPITTGTAIDDSSTVTSRRARWIVLEAAAMDSRCFSELADGWRRPSDDDRHRCYALERSVAWPRSSRRQGLAL